ncbi:MAG: DUF6636 domain-containing protein [Gaiellaceae bacterium]
MQRRPLIALVTGVAVLCVLGSGATASPSKARVSKDAYLDFRMPSNNIFCAYVATTGYPSYLRCDIESGLKPPPPKKVGKECSYGITVEMNSQGKSKYGCVSDAVYNTHARKLNYGSTWRHDGFTCTSKMAGLRCTNKSGHGFFLSRQHSYLF